MNIKKTLMLSAGIYFLSTFNLCAQSHENSPFMERQDVKAFIQHMVTKHHFDPKVLNQWFKQIHLQPTVISSITKPAEHLPWHRYQTIFLTPERIQGGVHFLRTHVNALKQAEQKYGVPAEIITAIIGVETLYGQKKGQYNVLDSLATLGFDYPPRAKFFLSELEQFLLLAREEQWDPTQIKGSYAGAMGTPQFIASSYRYYAVDFNENGQRDLLNSMEDAIGSVAHYFNKHGWQTGAQIAFPAQVNGSQFEPLLASKGNPKPNYTLQKMMQAGVRPAQLNQVHNHPQSEQNPSLALIALEGKEGPEYWLGTQNFYVITRYNRSELYAMAVYHLSQQIREAYLNELKGIS